MLTVQVRPSSLLFNWKGTKMTLQTFNVFGQVRISSNRIDLAYSAGKARNYKISSEELSPEINSTAVGKFIFGLSLTSEGVIPSYYVTQEIPGLEIETLPVVKKYMDMIVESVRQIERTSL